MKQNLPQLTHLQFAVLECLRTEESVGKNLREKLTTFSVNKSTPAFYQLMSRMEAAGYVAGRYQQSTIGDQIVRERFYKITGAGRAALAEAIGFYDRLNTGDNYGGIVVNA